MSRTLIRGGTVLTLGARTSNLVEGDVLIEEGRITEIGTGIRARGAQVIDAAEAIVMPGFVDTHRHLSRSLFRNAGDTAGSGDMTAYGPADVYAATLIGLLGAAEAGITTVADWSEWISSEQVSAALEAHKDSGLRTIFVDTRAPAEIRDTGVPMAWGAHLQNVDRGLLHRARSAGLRVHLHAVPGTSAQSGAGIPEGLLGEDATVVHGAGLDAGWYAALAEANAAVSLSPSSEMADGSGAPPVQTLMDAGITIGLGVGDERIAPGDMFAQMRSIISVQHATYFDLKLAGKGGLPNLLGTRQVIKYGTSDGAAAIGLGSIIGSLEVGKAADLIVLRTDRPNIYPINDPIGAVVWGMDTSNVDWVISKGRALMESGSLTGDVASARSRAQDAQRRVVVAAGRKDQV